MAKCKNCINLQNHWCDMVADSPDENAERECCTYERMTNADKIRSMSDEELAEFFENEITMPDDGLYLIIEGKQIWNKHDMLAWLQSEVEEIR